MAKYFSSLLFAAALVAILWQDVQLSEAQEKAGAHKKFLEPGAFAEQVTRSAQMIEVDLASPDKEGNLHRAQAEAAMIAGYARCAESGNTAGVEGSAWRLARIVLDKSKLAEAKKLAAGLAQLQGQPQGGESLLGKCPEDVGDLMNLLRPKAKGGEGLASELQSTIRLKGALNGIEEKLRALAKKKLTEPALKTEGKEISRMGDKLAVLAELTFWYMPPQKGNGTQKDWTELSLAMRDASLEMAAAARSNAEGTFAAARKLEATCSKCHNLFR